MLMPLLEWEHTLTEGMRKLNLATERSVTRALDASIAYVATQELDRLGASLTPLQAAEAIIGSLRAFRGLKSRRMPRYDVWDALLYTTWYQPSQINLAYSIARKVTKAKNPFRSGSGSLEVFDFGCGALAMQFGLALAAADTMKKHHTCPEITIASRDKNKSMRRIGKKLWRRFVDEIADEKTYPELNTLRQVCTTMKVGNYGNPSATRWLTVLHVAYRESAAEVKKALDARISKTEPDVVLVTAHPGFDGWAYSLDESTGYRKREKGFGLKNLKLFDGRFKETRDFRWSLFTENIKHVGDSLNPEDEEFSRVYLSGIVSWYPKNYESKCFFYDRQ